ncbi:MAG TPA: L-threonylcarbamoyladenylate synthase [Casimicrobiaceae bacterium]|nr:L-threonylcarbamoyladenylate synthase [Casimicrobiaceae bacterium]
MAQLFSVHPTHPQPRLIRQAAALIAAGGVIAYPTDSSYALGCGLSHPEAAQRILKLRNLDDDHRLTFVLADLQSLGTFARLDNWQFQVVRQGVPGPFTFIVPATREVPRRLQHAKRRTVGLRVPDHPIVRLLVAELGEPILSSTLLLPGDDEPLNDAVVIRERLQRALDAIVDGGACPAQPTTVVDLVSEPPSILREGRGDARRLGLHAP